VRFTAADGAADEGLRIVDLHRERVVLRRALAGMRMAVNLPVAAYRGVAIKLSGENGKPPRRISVTLEHADAALSLPLFCSADNNDIVAEWQLWGRVLGLPLLVAPSSPQRRRAPASVSVAAPAYRRASGRDDCAPRRT
jgi:hypothetical protein